MSNDNYPAGVTDAHPHFNPQEGSVSVTCGADEALLVPAFAIKTELLELTAMIENMPDLPNLALVGLLVKVRQIQNQVDTLEQEREYECPFEDVMDVDISEEAHWDCPVCGQERVSDTLPEERDPDEGWDNRYDD